jgi:hypothetical protein
MSSPRADLRPAAARRVPFWVPLAGALGVLTGAVSFGVRVAAPNPAPAWQALLVNFLFWTSLAAGALAWSAAFRIARTTWAAPVNRIAHSFAWYLPFCLAVLAALYPGRAYYLPWIGRDLGDLTSWLNVPFVFLRNGLGLMLLVVLGFAYVGIYLRVDGAEAGRPLPEDWQGALVEAPGANRSLSIVGVALLYVWALVLSILGLDFAMSLTVGWYSSLFPWYFLLGSAYSGAAALAVMAVALRRWLGVPGLIGRVPRRYLGNFVLAFAMAMTYFFYSQALPIWYENLPKEILFIIPRLRITPWLTVCWVVVFTTYLGVFFLFIVRELREIPATLAGVSLLALAGMWLERYLLVVPSLTPRAPLSPALVVLVGAGFLGVLVLTSAAFLARYPATSRLDLALEAEKEQWE